MNVLFLSHLFPPRGGSFVAGQAAALSKQGVNIKVITPVPWLPLALRSFPNLPLYLTVPECDRIDNLPVEYPRIPRLPKGRLFYLSGFTFYLRCRSIVKQLMDCDGLDLIHAHTIMPDGFAAALLGRHFGIPTVCTIHGSDITVNPYSHHFTFVATKWALLRIGRLVAVSNSLRDTVLSIAQVPQIAVVPNGADCSVFSAYPRTKAREKLGLSRESKIVIFIGNLVPSKGIDVLLDAFKQLGRPDTKLLIVGEGQLRRHLALTIGALGLSDSCLLVGQRPYSEIPLWLSAANCLVLPSLREGLGTVLIEAMLCSTTIIASNVGGIPDLIEHGVTGLLVPPGSPASLAVALGKLLDDESLANRLAAKALRRARNEYTWDVSALQLMDIYQHAISDGNGRAPK